MWVTHENVMGCLHTIRVKRHADVGGALTSNEVFPNDQCQAARRREVNKKRRVNKRTTSRGRGVTWLRIDRSLPRVGSQVYSLLADPIESGEVPTGWTYKHKVGREDTNRFDSVAPDCRSQPAYPSALDPRMNTTCG